MSRKRLTREITDSSQTEESEDFSETDAQLEGLNRFIGCYLLTSLHPSCKNHCYIGFTYDPIRRIRQHNGEIRGGQTKRTSVKRPWEMVLVIHGFPTSTLALQFEWAWQNTQKTTRLKHLQTAGSLQNIGNVWLLKAKIRFAYELLQVAPWSRLPLVINWFSDKRHSLLEDCTVPPIQMKTQIMDMATFCIYFSQNYADTADCPEDSGAEQSQASQPHSQASQSRLSQPTQSSNVYSGADSLDACALCSQQIPLLLNPFLQCPFSDCGAVFHLLCLGKHFVQAEQQELASGAARKIVPVSGRCTRCRSTLIWGDLIRMIKVTDRWREPRHLVDERGQRLQRDSNISIEL